MMAGMDFAYTFWKTSGNDADFKNLEVFMCMERETNAQKARRLLSKHGRACCCIQSTPEPGNQCGSIMGSGLSVSYTAKHYARGKGIILVAVH